jgi:hypothetical protein
LTLERINTRPHNKNAFNRKLSFVGRKEPSFWLAGKTRIFPQASFLGASFGARKVGVMGRPAKNEKSEVFVHEVLAEKMFSDGRGTQIFLTISRPFISAAKEKDEKPECRIELLTAKVGASGKEKFEIPVASLPFIQQSFVAVIARDKNRFMVECDRSSQAVALCLSIFSHRGKNRWNELMTMAIPVNHSSKDPEQQDPCSWLDRIFSEILEEVGDTRVIPSSASLDEMNVLVGALQQAA